MRGWRMHSPPRKINGGGMAILPSPQYGWITGHNKHTWESYVCLLSCIDKAAVCVLFEENNETCIGIFYFSSVKYQFYIHFQNKCQLGGSSTSPLLGLRPWNPLGDFRPQDTFPFASIHPLQSYRAVDATEWMHTALIVYGEWGVACRLRGCVSCDAGFE